MVAEIEPKKDVMEMLRLILKMQIETMERIKKMEENMVSRAEVLAHHKEIRETNVLVKRVHEMVCRMAGESAEDSEVTID